LEEIKVLDAMCGGGEVTDFFIRHNAIVTGIDISEECCKIYKSNFPNCKIICGSIIKTNFPDSYFDLVTTNSLHHLYPNLERGIDEISRILKPGGYLVMVEPNGKGFLNFLRRIWYKFDKKYFEENEKALDYEGIVSRYKTKFDIIKTNYGGNLGYLFINEAGILRIPSSLVKYYTPLLLPIEKFINQFQGKYSSILVSGLWRKK